MSPFNGHSFINVSSETWNYLLWICFSSKPIFKCLIFDLMRLVLGMTCQLWFLHDHISLFIQVKELEKYVFYPVSRAFKISCTIRTSNGTQRLFWYLDDKDNVLQRLIHLAFMRFNWNIKTVFNSICWTCKTYLTLVLVENVNEHHFKIWTDIGI